jgi:hypothetical protein
MRVALAALGFTALMLLSGCGAVQAYNPADFAGWSLERAQDACDAGNVAACNAANNLRGEEYNFI